MTIPEVEVTVELPIPDDVRVVAVHVREGISEHTTAMVELSSTAELDFEPLLNAAAGVVVRRDGREIRRFSLRIASGGFTRVTAGAYRYKVELRSPFWFLVHTLDTRKFRNLSSREIVAQVLTKDAIPHAFHVAREPPKRKYCTQYRESDRAFVERLLEFEGIYHTTDDSGTLVLADESGSSADIEGRRHFDLVDAAGALSQGDLGLQEISLGVVTASGKVTLNDFNWKKPSKPLLAAAGSSADLEVYDAPGGYRKVDQGAFLTRIRLEALRALHVTLEGRGNVPSFAPSRIFELGDRAGADFAGEHLLVRVEHFFSDARYGESDSVADTGDGAWGTSSAGTTTYANRFVAIPKGTPFRPPVETPIPNVAGCHTAMVRGPAGQEIHTDAYGRFRAQFHWDREAAGSDEDSRWMRMLQESHSSMFLARVGWEVNVSYIHGDADRPIGLARDINGVMPPAYGQPGKKSMMTIKSPSSPATGGYNEIRLDDNVGAMGIYVQAERDHRNIVKNDMSEAVGNSEVHVSGASFKRVVGRDQTIAVGASSTTVVGGTHQIEVTKDRAVTIGGSESVELGGSSNVLVNGNDTEKVGSVRLTIDGSVAPPDFKAMAKAQVPDAKSMMKSAGQAAAGSLKSGGGLAGAASAATGSLKAAIPTAPNISLGGLAASCLKGTIARTAENQLARTVGGAYISVSAASIETSASKLFLETIGGAKVTLAKGGINQSAGKTFMLTVGGAVLHTANGKMGIAGTTGVTIVGGMASLASQEKIEITGEEVEIAGATKLAFEGPRGSIVLEPGGIKMTGSVLLEPKERLKTTGKPINLTKAGA